MSTYSGYLLVATGFLVASCDVGVTTYRSDAGGPPSVAAFAESMREGDVQTFVDDLNQVKRDDPDPQVLAFLESLWQQSRTDTSPPFLKRELVLVELAATLAQASRNGAMRLDETEFHEVIRRGATSEDPDARERALFSLSIFDDSADIPLLTQAVESTDDSIFRIAIVALASMCAADAKEALRRVADSLREDRLAFLEETRAKYEGDPVRARLCESHAPPPPLQA